MRVGRCILAASLFLPAALYNSRAAGFSIDDAASAGTEISFEYVRAGLPVPRFTLRVRNDGTGRYQADQAARSAGDTALRGEAAEHIDRTFMLSPMMAHKIFNAAHDADHFNIACSSKAKHIADTGIKTLRYSGADGVGSCVYNYTENKSVAMLTDCFLGIAYTMDEGRRLDFLHRYDRLGLDAEINVLSQEVEAGRALELETISETLAAIADDQAVIQRARFGAARLLALARESQ